mmetsp:Transcript_17721/g.20486  ORF Transcript_17721/g.20486 Transcript_17721/m.20486 type:complete len:99 (-) Transcript_17721:162-458(-)
MSFFGYLNSPISIPPVYDTTPCLEHLMEYEDCVIDTNTHKLNYFMPTWPTLWPGMIDGKVNYESGGMNFDFYKHPKDGLPAVHDHMGMNPRQKQLLYE